MNTFTVAPIAVQGGDLLGRYEKFADCGLSGGAGMIVGNFGAQPPVGAVLTPTYSNSAFLSNISATLSPAMPGTKDDCKKGCWESFGVFKNQGDCVSWFATNGKNPPAGG